MTQTTDSPVVSFDKLNKSYKDKQVLRNLQAQIMPGQIVGLVGRNGAGKTTLIESIMGLKELDSGSISVWQQSLGKLSDSQKQRIGFVPQDNIGFEWMKVADYLSYFGGFFDGWDEQYADSLISKWKIDKKARIANLSGGQQQILQVIQAISIQPKLLILDEPVAHLDPNMRRQFLAELVELTCELGTTILFSTHIISDLERIASHIALLNNGCIEYFYELEDIKQHTAHLLFDKPIENQNLPPYLINYTQLANGSKATQVRPSSTSIEELETKLNTNITATPLSLEDWYLEVTNEKHN
ncbi:MAG: ABC transporter ATP-binding protein [Kangiellaceae bacterium]|nr:ABC transporter ATP-binding protein [Kangiellaceae bacterium]